MAQHGRADQAPGQQKSFTITGTDPVTGEALPERVVTQAEWRREKLGKQGYEKPADLDEPDEVEDDGSVEV